MFKKVFLFYVLIGFSINAYAVTMECTVPTQKEVISLFDRWNASLATLNSKEVVKNYSSDSVLHPTLLNEMLTDNKGKEKYFDSFLKSKPSGKVIQRKIYTGCNFAVDTGIYEFTLTDSNNQVSKAEARYTYVYELQKGNWVIINHTSALVPPKK